MIRTGKARYSKKGKIIIPKYPGYIPIVCLKEYPYYELNPFWLEDENNRLIHNLWQFSKIYNVVPELKIINRRNKVIWEYQSEMHLNPVTLKVYPEYFKWRRKGIETRFPITYPKQTFTLYHNKFFLNQDENKNIKLLSLIEARKEIFVEKYCMNVKRHPYFDSLVDLLHSDKKLLIVSFNGPDDISLNYYQNKYKVEDDFLKNDTLKIDTNTFKIILNDPAPSFSFSHCLAFMLYRVINGKRSSINGINLDLDPKNILY